MNNNETVHEVCAEMKDESSSHHRDYFKKIEIGQYANRILSAHKREMAAKDEERFKFECECITLRDRIALLESALKPVMECKILKRYEGNYLVPEHIFDSVREAQRIMREGDSHD